jgi:hypothetical protein
MTVEKTEKDIASLVGQVSSVQGSLVPMPWPPS